MKTSLAPLEVAATQGCKIHLAEGQTLIDGIASWWTAAHGYNHPHITQAIINQVQQLPHIMLGGLVHKPATRLCQRLGQLLGDTLHHVFFSDSGSVSVEVAIKMAVQYWQNHNEQRNKIICFQHGYHGDTFLTMALSDEGWMHDGMRAMLPKHFLQAIPDSDLLLAQFEKFLSQHAHTIAALIIEPLVQGAGGMKFYSPKTLDALCSLCKQHDILVIFDEIFTGFGRTGRLFAFEQCQTIPDIICLSKALTGGTLPLAATIANKKVYDAFLSDAPEKALMHGPTFMANATACAAANASLDLFENEPRLNQVSDIQAILKSELAPLRDVPGVIDVRVQGAIGVIQCQPFSTEELNWLKTQFIEDGVWLKPFYDIVYTTPALTISTEDLHQVTQSMINNVKNTKKVVEI